MTHDPLLQPFTLGNLTLRNRIVFTPHEPAYTEEGMPKDRYLAYHLERARGGVGLIGIGGSAVVSKDSPAVFGNIDMTEDEVVRWLTNLGDAVHEDLAWTYHYPVPAVAQIAGLIAFYNEKLDIVVDGARLPRPQTQFS